MIKTINEINEFLNKRNLLYKRVLILMAISILTIFVDPKLPLLIGIVLIICNFLLCYYQLRVITDYINKYQIDNYNEFKKSKFYHSLTIQRYHLFIKSKYYQPKGEEKQLLMNYEMLIRKVTIVHFGSFGLVAISFTGMFLSA